MGVMRTYGGRSLRNFVHTGAGNGWRLECNGELPASGLVATGIVRRCARSPRVELMCGVRGGISVEEGARRVCISRLA